MNFFAVRSFDHGGFYETRLVLMVAALLVSLYFLRFQRDPRYVFMFTSGAVFQALLEAIYSYLGFRAVDHSILIFGLKLEDTSKVLIQGLTEGGVLGVMSFWFADLLSDPERRKQTQEAFVLVCAVIVGMSVVVGIQSSGAPVTAARPMFGPYAVVVLLIGMAAGAELGTMREGGKRALLYFGCGLMLYSVLTFAPLNIAGAQFMGPKGAAGGFSPAQLPFQILLSLWTHVIEDGAGKLHYFAIPFCFGMVELRNRNREPDEPVQDLLEQSYRSSVASSW